MIILQSVFPISKSTQVLKRVGQEHIPVKPWIEEERYALTSLDITLNICKIELKSYRKL